MDKDDARGQGPGMDYARGQGPEMDIARGQGLGPDSSRAQGLELDNARGQGLQPDTAQGQGLGPDTARGQGLGSDTARGQGLGPDTARGQGSEIGGRIDQGFQGRRRKRGRRTPSTEEFDSETDYDERRRRGRSRRRCRERRDRRRQRRSSTSSDVHSQDEILAAISKLQEEVCVKFFHTPANYTATEQVKILYISNPDRRKECPPDQYDFSGTVVDMPIGYRCLNTKDIARILVAMLRASIEHTVTSYNSLDLIKKFRERDAAAPRPGLLSSEDRNFINAHYHGECGTLAQQVVSRRVGSDVADTALTPENLKYYEDKMWPLGIVMYAVHPNLTESDPNLKILVHAMATIELASCVVFQRVVDSAVLAPKNFLWLSEEGEEVPELGFKAGKQPLKLSALARGAPGHSAHALHMLLRALGLSMMSNRFDRDNYVKVLWKHVQPGKEHLLEKSPEAAWLLQVPYDFTSASHAPANYMCRNCQSPLSANTVLPVQDHLWQKTVSMGHRVDLSDSDKETLGILYSKQCQARFIDKN